MRRGHSPNLVLRDAISVEGRFMGAVFEKFQWNYKVLKEPIPSSEGEIMELEKKLSDLGSRYWEVVSVNHMTNSPHMLIYLKSTKWRTIVSTDR
jgi:hypothetical protein